MKKRGGGGEGGGEGGREGGGPEAQNNSRTENRNYNHFHDSKEVMSPPPPLEEIYPIVQTNSSFAMWTHRQLETGPPRFPIFQIRKQTDGEMEKFKIFGLYESMMMNFIETVAETDIPPFLNVALQVRMIYVVSFVEIAYAKLIAGVLHWKCPILKGLVSHFDADEEHFHQIFWKMSVFQDFDHQ